MLGHGAGAVKAACLTDDARAILRPLTTRDERFPFPPFPDGWYALCLSAELPAGSVRGTAAFGRRLVLFRTASGRAAVAEAFCPHLGADLSRGGRVEGDLVVCPFHGLAFDAGGACRGGPYSPLPQGGLSAVETRESHGLLLAWHAADGRPPE
ncbi:MAG: Rieske (2Fe-2S) protein, partial [Acidobacteria bacterium ACB2]|nr:Rieske (2Fe-2S) protein [Acidobacteria bacterium ACB2]